MKQKSGRLCSRFFIILVLMFGNWSPAFSLTVARSDILLHIATQCVDPSSENYCSSCLLPRVDGGCGVSECKNTNEVWALTQKYAAIRDIKMCGCLGDFVHGLALPREPVTGIEDPNREEDIWQFAWDVGVKRISPESLALVVNSKSERTQNQLHVHILALQKNARASLVRQPHAYIKNLDQIWVVAAKIANSQGLSDYGLLLAKEDIRQYIVVVTPYSPETAFTRWHCSNGDIQ